MRGIADMMIAHQRAVITGLREQLAQANERADTNLRALNRISPLLAEANARLAELNSRYAFEENQRLCIGYEGKCDGDLTATEHEEDCPARQLDVTLRPHLYRAAKE